MRVHGQLLLKLARIVDSQPVAPSRFLPRRRAVASSSLHSAGEVLHSSIGLRSAPHAALHMTYMCMHMCSAPRRAPRTMAAHAARAVASAPRGGSAHAHTRTANAVCRSGTGFGVRVRVYRLRDGAYGSVMATPTQHPSA